MLRQNAPSAVWAAMCHRSVTCQTMDLHQETRARARNCALCAENLLLSNVCTGALALPKPSVCRKNGLLRPIGHLDGYRFASRIPGARPYSGRARSKSVICQLLWDVRTGALALPEPSVGRKNGLYRPIGHLNGYRFASRNPGARPYSGRARSKSVVLSAAIDCAHRRACPA